MDFRQLTVLIAVAETGSFSAAARSMHTVQSNISTHVARLERELGVSLVNRADGALTEEGEVVLRRARHIQGELDALTADVAALRDEVTGSVRFGCIGTAARWLVPLVLEHLSAAHPKVRVVVVDATTSSLVPSLLRGDLDLAVVNLPVHDPELVSEPLFDEEWILIAPGDHPLSGQGRLSLTDLGGHELLLPPVGTATRDELDAEAGTAGVTLRPLAEVDGLRLIATLAFQGYGPAIVPATAAPKWLEGHWGRVAIDGLTPRSVGLVRRSRGLLSAPARALRNAVAEVVVREGPKMEGVHPFDEA